MSVQPIRAQIVMFPLNHAAFLCRTPALHRSWQAPQHYLHLPPISTQASGCFSSSSTACFVSFVEQEKKGVIWLLIAAEKRLACLLGGVAAQIAIRRTSRAEWWEGTNRDASKFNKWSWQRAPETGVGKYEAGVTDSWFYIALLTFAVLFWSPSLRTRSVICKCMSNSTLFLQQSQ